MWRNRSFRTMDLNHPLFDTDAWRLALSSLGCYCVTSLVVAAGVGGGGILVPMYAVILGLAQSMLCPFLRRQI